MKIDEQIPLVEEILDDWKTQLGGDYQGYKNHVYRMINCCFALRQCSAGERQKIIIAGCFHDLGIWSDNTFDYLSPSVALGTEYLKQNNLAHWIPEIELMIGIHHKLRQYQNSCQPLVEVFRQGDLVDFSLGLFKCGLPANYIKALKTQFPNAGFHKRLLKLAGGWICRHPLNPLPVLKW